jgi:hypothetical protein
MFFNDFLAMNGELPANEVIYYDEDSSLDLVFYDSDTPSSEFVTSEMLLMQLLSQITLENCHSEISTGSAVGEEIW